MSNMNVNAITKINTTNTLLTKISIIIDIIISGIISIIRIINRLIGIYFRFQLAPIRIPSDYPRNNRINRTRYGKRI